MKHSLDSFSSMTDEQLNILGAQCMGWPTFQTLKEVIDHLDQIGPCLYRDPDGDLHSHLPGHSWFGPTVDANQAYELVNKVMRDLHAKFEFISCDLRIEPFGHGFVLIDSNDPIDEISERVEITGECSFAKALTLAALQSVEFSGEPK